MRRFFNRQKLYSFSAIIILWFVFIIGCVLLISSFLSYHHTIKDLEKLSINFTNSIISEINMNIDSYIDSISNMTDIICSDDDVISLLKSEKNDDKTREMIIDKMNIIAKTRSDITNIAIIPIGKNAILGDSNKPVNDLYEYMNESWYKRPLSDPEKIYVAPTHVERLVKNENPWVISVSRAILSPDDLSVLGVMVVDLNFYNIKNYCKNVSMGSSGYVFIVNNNLDLVYHPRQQLIYAGLGNDPVEEITSSDKPYSYNDLLYTKSKSNITDWWIIGAVNKNELVKDRLSVLIFYLYVWIVFLIIAIIISFFVSKSISLPISRLEETMQLVENGNLSIRANTDTYSEIGHLSNVFNGMIYRIGILMEKTVHDEKIKRESEIKALQAQINPHFLYNTLDTIIWLAALGDSDKVVSATSALANLFRTSISRKEKYITLDTELDNIENYLIIQKLRFGEKLTFTIDVDESFYRFCVPKLVLQPIVENSIIHGIGQSEGSGNVNIGAVKNGDMLILTVSDNGVGIDKNKLSKILKTKVDTNSGIGVNNVNDRIKLCFGEEYGLDYFSAEGLGTRVEIRLPIFGIGDDIYE